MKRRRFLKAVGAAGGASFLGFGGARGQAVGQSRGHPPGVADRLVILHTNDTHSRMDPFPMDGGPFQGLGGAARRATLIRRVRDANEHVLLLDSGDILQGTPYFNFFGGEVEFRAMTAMGYDVATLGNHDFDNGVDGLARMLPLADFEFVSANYDVSGTPLSDRVRPYTVREIAGVKVGIFGLGIGFQGLVLSDLHEGVTYNDPVPAARQVTEALRAAGCSLIVCLSHLGYRYTDSSRPSDQTLAAAVPGIDLILGGHTHTFLDQPDIVRHEEGRPTLISQMGWGGMRLGRVDVAVGDGDQPPQWSAAGYPIDPALDGAHPVNLA
ncbi:MAG: bifunctional metallophosphatase/5'-nucleotidase [Longimicrobiales bacterium]